jgi:tRNA A37 threonylcarbamoyladenosine dehydratase
MPEERRFGGIARLYGDAGAARIAAAHVAVVGLGGVGSWVVEALARSGVGRLTLIDMDHVAESNMNRQLPALDTTVGMLKADVLAQRSRQINPALQIRVVDDFVDRDNLARLITPQFDWVVDCIDNFRVKAAMIAHCRGRRQAIITVGAAGGQIDPTRVRVSDLRRTEQDALLARTRRLLRQDYGFPGNPRRSFGVPAVWSDEPVRVAQGCGTQQDSSLNCAGYGACMPVTAGMGMAAAAHVLRELAAAGRAGGAVQPGRQCQAEPPG